MPILVIGKLWPWLGVEHYGCRFEIQAITDMEAFTRSCLQKIGGCPTVVPFVHHVLLVLGRGIVLLQALT